MNNTMESAYTQAQYWVNKDGKTLQPYAFATVLGQDGAIRDVPTNNGVELKMLAGDFMEDALALTGETVNNGRRGIAYKVALSGASTTVGALRYRSLLASKETEDFGIVIYDPQSRAFKGMVYFYTDDNTRTLMKGDKKAWRSEGVPGFKNLLHGRLWPSFTRENKMLETAEFIISEVYHRPGETVEDIHERMVQTWFDNLRRFSELPMMPHLHPDEPHPWASPLFNYFNVSNQLKWLSSIGPAVTKFEVPSDIQSVIERSIATGGLPDIRSYVDFLDPSTLDNYKADDFVPEFQAD